MKKSTIAIAVVILIVIGVVGAVLASNKDDTKPQTENTPQTSQNQQQSAAQSQQQTASDDQSADSEVEIEDFAFAPATITVKKGTKVTWTNRDSVQHDVAPDAGDSDAFKKGPLLAKDESYSFTFNTPGTYKYHCSPHPQMMGTVVVAD